jgi:GNAT superfamily N-acetyltransferase
MMTIRVASPDDNEAISAVQMSAIRGLCSTHYAPEQIEAWASRRTPELFARVLENQELHVAERDGRIIGFGQVDLESGQIVAVYVAPEVARTGVGEALLRYLEGQARMHGWPRLHLTASLNSVPFYEKMGYEAVVPFEHMVATDVKLPCLTMRRMLPKEAEAPRA